MERPAGVIYIGDDVSDEDALRALKDKGLCVSVGRGRRSPARYRLKNPADVNVFLKRLYRFLKEA
jgi:trehalose 6-phosphate phosphatase